MPLMRFKNHALLGSLRMPIIPESSIATMLTRSFRKLDHKLMETTWVHKIFGGRLRSRVTCRECHHPSDTFDSILDLSLDIHGVDTLKDALRKFVAIDYLKGADRYKCEKYVL